ncbi:hypothetical protein ACQV88_25785, partial [Ralstonia pseudosolanacearum]|uniref:hypothetical protein n=1 Tax=Ralstonia pseudosolanacearum TaxID=1310165 RepID=UPI003D2A836B
MKTWKKNLMVLAMTALSGLGMPGAQAAANPFAPAPAESDPVVPEVAASAAPQHGAPTIYVDCAFRDGQASEGTAIGSMDNPVSDLAYLNAMKIEPGSQILFRRGATCHGSFMPAKGSSGTADAPIIVDAYGGGSARPVIAAGCRETDIDPNQEATQKTIDDSPIGKVAYHSLCRKDSDWNRAALHLYNVEYWEINGLELTNDALSEGNRV